MAGSWQMTLEWKGADGPRSGRLRGRGSMTAPARVVLCAIALALWRPWCADAQDVTVEQLVAMAIERAPQLRAARTDIAVAAASVTQAELRPNPLLLLRHERGSDRMADTSIDVEWPLDLFRRSARTDAARRAGEAAALSVRDDERVLAAAIRDQAGRLMAARRMLEVTNEALAGARRMRDLLDRRLLEGGIPQLEANLAAVEALRIEADAALASGEAEAAAFELKALAGLPDDAPLQLVDSLESLVRVAPATATATIDGRPDIGEARARVTLAEADAENARRAGGLDLTVTGGYRRLHFDFDQQGFDARGELTRVGGVFRSLALGATVPLPLFDRNQGAVASALAEHGRAKAILEDRQRVARAELAAATARDREARRAVELYASTVRGLARQNVDVTLEAYDLGRFPLSDLLTEQRRYLETEAGYTEVLSRAYHARVALGRALGQMP
jgi:outer membrane protein, heavy metal efflux system